MIGKTDIVDEFIGKLRRHPALKGAVPIIDHLEAVLEDLFISPNRQAIQMSDEIRAVMERKHMSMEKRVIAIRKILNDGSNHL